MSAERPERPERSGGPGGLGRVGFVGLGNMGMPMARRLAAAGYHVCGFDASAEIMRTVAGLDGFSAAPGVTAVGDGASAVILSLPDSDVVEHVLLGSDQQHMLDHIGVRQAQDDRARVVADRCQAGRRAEAVESGDGPHDLGRDVEAADVVPGRGQPPGHRHAHVAEADETDAT